MVRGIELTPALRAAIAAVDAAEAIYTPGAESASVIELPKLALATALIEAVRAQERRLERLPQRADQHVVSVQVKPRRRRA